MRRVLVCLAVLLTACGGTAATADPTEAMWPKSMADTTCAEWRDNDVMSDAQRNAAARAVVGATMEVAFVFDVNETCDTLARLATDPSDPASVQEVMDFVLTMEDVYQTSAP
jgi:ABC-type hemin transport system ATPase subunit